MNDTWLTAAVLFAAFTHASWHAMLKTQGDQLRTIASVYAVTAVVCVLALPFVEVPGLAALGYIGASMLLHCAS